MPPDPKGVCCSRAHAHVPFGAALRRLAAIVLARCSAPERVRLIADSGAVGGTHSTGCRERFSMLCSRGRRPPCSLRLLRPGTWVIPANDPVEGLVVTLMMPSRSVGVDPRP